MVGPGAGLNPEAWYSIKHLDHLLLVSQVHEQGAGLEVQQQPRLKLALTWEANVAGCNPTRAHLLLFFLIFFICLRETAFNSWVIVQKQSQELQLAFPWKWLDVSHLSHHQCFPGVAMAGSWNQKLVSGIELGTFMDYRGLNCCCEHPALTLRLSFHCILICQ